MKINRIIVLVWSVLVFSLLFSCKSEKEDGISAKLDQSLITAQQTSVGLDIVSSSEWEVAIPETWISCDQSLKGSGNATLNLRVEGNNSLDVRGMVITVTSAGGKNERVMITQQASTVTFNPASIVFDDAGTPQTIALVTIGKWRIINPEAAPWCKFSALKGGGATYIVLTSEPITGIESRPVVNINVECEGQTMSLPISHPFHAITAPILQSPADKVSDAGIRGCLNFH